MHESKTYLGLQEDADIEEFFAKVRQSERDKQPVDHDRYVNSVPSRPGMQYLIPGGTIHSSGRNQVVLELGSCTMGSMTFKLYDYARLDLDGNTRPIHSLHGKKVLQTNRRTNWVKQNLVQEPRLVEQGDGWEEYIVGDYPSIFYQLRRLEFKTRCEGQTNGWFHVLALVDGERVRVQALEDPEKTYDFNFMDIIVVPASIKRYELKNLSEQPVRVYKVIVKPEYEIGKVTR